MAISTYSELQSSMADFLNRSDLTSVRQSRAFKPPVKVQMGLGPEEFENVWGKRTERALCVKRRAYPPQM